MSKDIERVEYLSGQVDHFEDGRLVRSEWPDGGVDHYEDEFAALPQGEEQWRPVSDAPTGVDVLVCVGPSSVPGWCVVARLDSDGSWINANRPDTATHRTVLVSVRGWMPLPAPCLAPESGEGGADNRAHRHGTTGSRR